MLGNDDKRRQRSIPEQTVREKEREKERDREKKKFCHFLNYANLGQWQQGSKADANLGRWQHGSKARPSQKISSFYFLD